MTKEKVAELSTEYFHAIKDYYGLSKFHDRTPYLSIEDSPYSDDDVSHDGFGEYSFDEMNEIIIYWKNIITEEDIIRTIIHEYTHYLQSPSWFKRYYNIGYDYNNHPYEIAAFNEEENWKIFYKK